MHAVRLDDAQIERYSRQIVLPEIGAEGQCRLLAARVAVAGTAAAAGDVVGQLAAAGLGTIATTDAAAAGADPASETRMIPLAGAATEPVDALALIEPADTADVPVLAAPPAIWLADGRMGGTPPCAACAARVLGPPPQCPPELAPARDALLAAQVTTEIIKQVLAIGTPLAGRVLTYDPSAADVVITPVAPDPACRQCAPRGRED